MEIFSKIGRGFANVFSHSFSAEKAKAKNTEIRPAQADHRTIFEK
jgi:hypothetical protein